MPIRRLVLSLHLLRIPFHVVALAADVYVGAWVLKNCEPHTWPGHLAMLTHWGHLLQTIYLAFVLFQDLRWLFFSSADKSKQHPKRQNTITETFFSVCFILSSMIGFLFWGLYFYNRELILPEALDATYPSHINMHQHGWTAVIMWIELLVRHHHNLSAGLEYGANIGIGIVYLLWTCVIAYMDRWPYPFQHEMDLIASVIFYLCCLTTTTVWTAIKRGICRYLYGEHKDIVGATANGLSSKKSKKAE